MKKVVSSSIKNPKTKSLVILFLFTFGAFAFPSSLGLIAHAQSSQPVAAQTTTAMALSLHNELANTSFDAVTISAPTGWTFDKSATCADSLSAGAVSSEAVTCAGLLSSGSTHSLQFGAITAPTYGTANFTALLHTPNGSILTSFPVQSPDTAVALNILSDQQGNVSAAVASATPEQPIASPLQARPQAQSAASLSGVSPDTPISGTSPLVNNYYFNWMSNNSEIYWNLGPWENYPNFAPYGNQYSPIYSYNNGNPGAGCNGACPTQSIGTSRGFVENTYTTVIGEAAEEGIIAGGNLNIGSGSSLPNGVTFSFQMTGDSNSSWLATPELVYSPTDSTTNYGATFLMFSITQDGHPFIERSGTVLWTSSVTSYFAAWTVRLTATSSYGTVSAYLNTGQGFQLVYTDGSDSGLSWMNTAGGEVYLLEKTTVNFSHGPASSIAYFSEWNPNNPIEEATLDMNMWYMTRHYVIFPSSSGYGNEAAILDSDSTPIWITYGSDTLYTGQAVDAPQCTAMCQAQGQIEIQEQFSEQYKITFYDAGSIILTLLVENNQSSIADLVTYTLSATQCNPASNSISVYEGSELIFSTPKSASCSGNYQSTLNFYNGQSGLRYVGRHVTEVTAYLSQELYYGKGSWTRGSQYAPDISGPLSNFMQSVDGNCYAESLGCPSVYGPDYYAPLFPSTVDTYGGTVSDTWYDTTNAFPPRGFYLVQPYGADTVINSPSSQFGDTYMSRLSIASPPINPLLSDYATADNAWLVGVMQYGYTSTTQALKAAHLVDKYGTTDLSQAESLLDSAQWDGYGVNKLVCVGPKASYNPLCFSETAYATYATASFLGAASVVGAAGGGKYEQWAQQAMGVIEDALWSGANDILGQNEPVTLWQSVGGEMSAYTAFDDPVQYSSNQGGIIQQGTELLAFFGYDGIQENESPGFMVANTECTSISAAAILLYLTYLGNVSPIASGSSIEMPSSQLSVGSEQCSIQGDCSFAPQENGYMSESVTQSGAVATTSLDIPVTITDPLEQPTLQGGFWVNGTLASGSSLTLTMNLLNGSGSVTGYGVEVTQASTNQLIPIDGIFPYTVEPGSYTLQFVATLNGVGDFGAGSASDLGYILAQEYGIFPNSLVESFIDQAQWYTGGILWNTYSAGPTSSPSNTLSQNAGMVLKDQSSTGAEADYGVSSQGSYSFANSLLFLTADLGNPQTSLTSSCIALTPDSVGSSLLGSKADYISACNTGTQLVITTKAAGTANSYTASTSAANLTVSMELSPDGTLDVQYNLGSGLVEFPGFPWTVSSGSWPSRSVTLYIYQATTSQSQVSSYYSTVDLGGDPPAIYYEDNVFGTVLNPNADGWLKYAGAILGTQSVQSAQDGMENGWCAATQFKTVLNQSSGIVNQMSIIASSLTTQRTTISKVQMGIYNSSGYLLASGTNTSSFSIGYGTVTVNVHFANRFSVKNNTLYFLAATATTSISGYLDPDYGIQNSSSFSDNWNCGGSGTLPTSFTPNNNQGGIQFDISAPVLYTADTSSRVGYPAPSLQYNVPARYLVGPVVNITWFNQHEQGFRPLNVSFAYKAGTNTTFELLILNATDLAQGYQVLYSTNITATSSWASFNAGIASYVVNANEVELEIIQYSPQAVMNFDNIAIYAP